MSDYKGPVMLVATEALRPPKLRIGKLGNNFTLPRTVPVVPLIVGSITGLISIGIFISFVGASIGSVSYSGILGALFGVALVTYSPLRGESLAKWLGLKVKSRKGRTRMMDGRPVRLAVGICYVAPPNTGQIDIRPGSVPVRPGLFDDRGVRVKDAIYKANPISAGQVYTPRQIFAPLPPSPKISVQERIAAYRSATQESVLPEDLPEIEKSPRRFGRWSQDGDSLRNLYNTPSQSVVEEFNEDTAE
jgi:hypothetical protein